MTEQQPDSPDWFARVSLHGPRLSLTPIAVEDAPGAIPCSIRCRETQLPTVRERLTAVPKDVTEREDQA